MTLEKTWVGIDVSKASLDVYLLPQGTNLQVPNPEAGVRLLIEQLSTTSPPLVVVESTGGSERTLVEGGNRQTFPLPLPTPEK